MELYIAADKVAKKKHEYSEMGMSFGMGLDIYPVDLNYAYVPMEVTQASKDSTSDMDKAAYCNLERFGLDK